MRTFLTATVLIAVFSAFAVYAEPNEREARRLVKEWCAESPTDERRAEILKELQSVAPDTLQRPLKRHLRDKEECAPAIALAAQLRIPGLTDDVRKHMAEHEEQVLDYLFAVQEGSTAADLVALWMDPNTNETTMQRLTERMCEHWLPPNDLQPLRNALADEDRQETTLRIARFQLIDPDASAEDMLASWDDRIATASHEGKPFKLKGNDLFELPWDMSNATKVRDNYRIDGLNRVVFLKDLPKDWQRKNFTLRLNVCAGEAETVAVQLTSSDPGQNAIFNYKPGVWFIELGGSFRSEKNVDKDKWVVLELRVEYRGTDKQPELRNVRTFVNDEELKIAKNDYSLNAPLASFQVNAQRSTKPVLIGGGEWWFD